MLESSLLDELIQGYVYNVFEEWKDQPDADKRNELFGKVNGAHDLHWWIRTKCEGIVDGN